MYLVKEKEEREEKEEEDQAVEDEAGADNVALDWRWPAARPPPLRGDSRSSDVVVALVDRVSRTRGPLLVGPPLTAGEWSGRDEEDGRQLRQW
jgi:hypothetical protein